VTLSKRLQRSELPPPTTGEDLHPNTSCTEFNNERAVLKKDYVRRVTRLGGEPGERKLPAAQLGSVIDVHDAHC
jgi:hypothetical protein